MQDKIHKAGNFNYSEFLVSSSYPELLADIKLRIEEQLRIKLLVETILQPVRDRWGATTITSGKRTTALNLAVKGTPDSDHLYACAADFVCKGQDMLEVFKWILDMELHFKELIFYPEAKTPFIHASINIPGRDFQHEAMIKRGGKYENWG